MSPLKLVELFKLVGAGHNLVWCLVIWVSTGGFLLLRYFSGVFHTIGISRCHNTLFLSSTHRLLIIGLIRTTAEAKGEGLHPVKLV